MSQTNLQHNQYFNYEYIYAGFWRRFVAFLVDSVILFIVNSLIGAGLGLIPSLFGGIQGKWLGIIVIIGVYLGIYFIGFVVNWIYYTILESSLLQATLGKKLMGIVVTDSNTNKISFGRANARYWSKYISMFTFLIGYFIAGFTPKKQALHDIIASTLVIKKIQ